MHFFIDFVTHFIEQTGYFGVFVTMLLSACVPFPSEVVLPFAGSMIVTRHMFNFQALVFAGAFGNLAGSMIAYGVGAWKGREFLEKYGRFVLIRRKDIAAADYWFARHGEAAVFFTRMMPVVRAFISLPAGITRMPFGRFCVYSFLGGLPWCYLLGWAGLKMGQHWEDIMTYFHKADLGVGVVFVILVGVWLRRHLKDDPEPAAPPLVKEPR